MSFYDEMADMAADLLSDFDQGGISLLVYTDGGGSPHNPLPPVYIDTPVNGVVEGVSAHHLADSLIQSSDLVLTIDGRIKPKMQDRASMSGDVFTIIKIEATPATGVSAAYDVFIRH